MSVTWALILLPFASVHAFLMGLLLCRWLGARTQEQVVPVMALSALGHLGSTALAGLGRPLALMAFWSFAHLIAIPFVLRLAGRRD